MNDENEKPPFITLSPFPKDLDFVKLRERVRAEISKAFGIPQYLTGPPPNTDIPKLDKPLPLDDLDEEQRHCYKCNDYHVPSADCFKPAL